MTVELQVAGWGPAFGYPHMQVFGGEQFADQGEDVPYAQRKTVVIEAEPSTMLGEVIDEAASLFGVTSLHAFPVSEQVHWVAFFRPEDETGMPYEYDRWHAAIRVADESGPSWPVHWSAVRVDELLAAADVGLVDGDPLRPYFWPVIPQGELVDVVAALWTLWQTWEHLLSARESTKLGRALLRRVRRAMTASQDDSQAWRLALRRPQDLVPYLEAEPRTVADVAQRTSLPTATAEGLLLGMGYIAGDDGRWRRGEDEPAALLARELLDLKTSGRVDLEEASRRVQRAVERSESNTRARRDGA